MECSIARLELCVRDRVLQMELPPNSSRPLPSVDESRLVAVDVLVRDEKDVTRNGETVRIPDALTSRVGKKPLSTVAEVATSVQGDAGRIGVNKCVGVVNADNTVPVECVAEVLDILASSGVTRFDVMSWAGKIPAASDRERETLQYPKQDGR